MTETINFSFNPNKDDYIKSLRVFSIRQKSTLIVTSIMLVLSIFGLIASAMFGSLSACSTFVVPLILFFYLLFLVFINPIHIGDQVEKNERLSCETRWEVDDHGVSMKTDFAETKFDWETFGEVIETDEHFLIVYAINKQLFQIVPKRAFSSSAQLAEFRTILNEKIAQHRQSRAVNLPSPSKKALYFIMFGVFFLMMIIVAVYNFLLVPIP